jgi:hypothetical protein
VRNVVEISNYLAQLKYKEVIFCSSDVTNFHQKLTNNYQGKERGLQFIGLGLNDQPFLKQSLIPFYFFDHYLSSSPLNDYL